MISFRNSKRSVPGLNTASLPDLIFSVLFFFMLVTHMRKSEIKVKYQIPQGTELTKLTNKSTITYIYIGKNKSHNTDDIHIQINDKLANESDIADYVSQEKNNMSPQDIKNQTISINADKNTPMKIINSVKKQLRMSETLKVNFSAINKKTNTK